MITISTSNKLKKAYIFGAGHVGRNLLTQAMKEFEIIAFLDNDKTKWESTFDGFTIYKPEIIVDADYDVVITASLAGFNLMIEQLIDLGVPQEKICTDYVVSTVQSRIVFLERLAWMFHEKGLQGCVAECGVFMGEFAREINRVFPNHKFYLFDTFSGFDERDVAHESKNQYSELEAGHFNITTEELVLSKLPNPNTCIIRKGYFPETTEGLDETFCFVNLDFDLYQPTLAGLEYFAPRMVKGGVILVHDYFAAGFRGVKAAVNDFNKANEYNVIPIGDGLSVLLPF